MSGHGSSRREFLEFAGLGGIVFASGLLGCGGSSAGRGSATTAGGAGAGGGPANDFFFLQLSDTHWGYTGAANPESARTLPLAIERVLALPAKPDFIVFTGDLTHTTDDGALRRKRLAEFKALTAKLGGVPLHLLPGEHDAALDKGEAYREAFGEPRKSFDHKGVHFVVLDNVSDPNSSLGEEQIEWLRADVSKLDKEAPIVILTHRPLFDLYPSWDWVTKDGGRALEALAPYRHVTVFYGHIHQEHHLTTGNVAHHAARSLIFPLPAPGSVPKKAPVAWDPAHPFAGLGYRRIDEHRGSDVAFHDFDLQPAAASNGKPGVQTATITAESWSYSPALVTLRRGVPAVLELKSTDRRHGFAVPELHLRADVRPGQVTRLAFTPEKLGSFPFHCDVFCGDGHESMGGRIEIVD
jgi:3',5'-cyclic AMP phosphodiesterase CpdA